MSQSASNTDSGAPSPEAQYRMAATSRSDSPSNVDYNNNHNHNDVFLRSSHHPQHIDGNHHQHQNSESLFAQGGSHSVYNNTNNFPLLPDYLSDSDNLSLKQQPHGSKSPSDFGTGPFRSSFSAYNGVHGAHTSNTNSGNAPPSSFRMRQTNGPSTSQSFGSASEGFANHQPLSIQHQLSQQSGASVSSGFESRGMDFGSTTPMPKCRILMLAFPDDMQEREFQNMFTFSSGFEAATLKIPNKEYTAYGSSGGTPSGFPFRGSSSYSSYLNSGPNDPYNIVTVNQGGVLGHFQGPGGLAGQPPRKQIIGFAKFRTRQEALDARDMLQGRRVDIEKGAVLKAEMAKKNLHTKRGVGIGSTSSSGGSVSVGNNANGLTGLNGGVGLGGLGNLAVAPDTLAGLAGLNLNATVNLNSLATLGRGDSLVARERDLNALGAMGYSNLSSGWREGRFGDSSEEERDRDRDRERRREALGAMGLNLGMGISRGARERALADEEERERLRRKDLKGTSENSQNGLLSPVGGSSNITGTGESGSSGPSPILGNGYGGIIAQTSGRDEIGQREAAIGPWDQPLPRERDAVGYAGLSSFYAARRLRLGTDSPPKSNSTFSPSLNEEEGMLPAHRSGVLRSTQSFASVIDEPVQAQVTRPSVPPSIGGGPRADAPAPLAVSTSGQVSTGNTSPQLPSPASHASSASSSGGGHTTSSSSGGTPNVVGGTGPRNPLVDQNPPINTLYVGNLPTGPVGGGYPANYLEDSLRELFSRRLGYRKLCFRQKSNGPMCFVEFEDVHYATKTLNELYGNTLGGLVKNGGIRLSYSKNPLGVRTPTSAGTGSSLQQQQSNAQSGVSSPFPEGFQPRQGFDGESGGTGIRRDSSTPTSPPPSAFGGYARSPPPPRFFSPPPPSGSFGIAPSTSPTNGTTLPRSSHTFGISLGGTGGGTNFSPFGLPISSPPAHSGSLPPLHSTIPDHPSSDVPLSHGHSQHFPHRALSPTSTLEAARAG
ncbi:hypothetical protein BU15DRAFT_62296 [Melanogaster broomeanus]|nr:hypothetical protein BU15DRAFT_62296 [Melanogaster broomeanus]